MDADHIIQARVLVAALFTLFAPGALLLAITGTGRRLPAMLLPVASFAVSVAVMSLLVLAQLALHLDTPLVTAVLVLGVVALAATHVILAARHHDQPGERLLLGLFTWPVTWMRGVPRGALLAAGAAGVIGYFIGGHFFVDGDSYFHAAIATKLLHLSSPDFQAMAQFKDGDPHPGYLVPGWHGELAVIAQVARASVMTTMRVLPALLAPLTILAWAGLAQVSLRSAQAGTLAAVAVLSGRFLMTPPGMDGVSNAAEPRTITSNILLPLAWALVLAAAARPLAVDVGVREDDHDVPVDALRLGVLAAVVAATLTLVHVSYVVWMGVGIVGYVVAVLARGGGLRQQADRRRHLYAVGAPLLAAGAVVAGLWPAISRLNEGGSTHSALQAIVLGDGMGRHLRADYLVWYGGLALLGVVGAIVLCRYLRDPLAGFVPVTMALVGVLVVTPGPFHVLASLVNPAQATRAYLAVPWALGLAGAGVIVAQAFDVLWWRDRGPIVAVASWAAALVAVVGLCAWAHALHLRTDPAVYPPVIVIVLLVALVVALVLGFMAVRRHADEEAPLHDMLHPAHAVGGALPIGTLLVALLILLGSAPALVTHQAAIARFVDTGPWPAMPPAGLGAFDRPTLRHIQHLPAGSVVLADPSLSYRLLAAAPQYAVAVSPGHVADTSANRPYDRAAAVDAFYRDGTSAEQRLKLLEDEHVRYVVVRNDGQQDVRKFLLAPAQRDIATPLVRGPKTWLFRIAISRFAGDGAS